MSITIQRHRRPVDEYEPIRRSFLRDAQLSMAARGLGGYLLTHTEKFELSEAKLAEFNGCGVTAIKSAIGELEEGGYLRREQTRTGSGRMGPMIYEICDEPIFAQVEPGMRNSDIGETGTGAAGDIRETNSKETKREEISPTDVGVLDPIHDPFEQFWEAYRLKVGKGQAARAFRAALKKTDLPTILEGVQRYLRWLAMDLGIGEFRPAQKHPATWLNGECWADELPGLPLVTVGSGVDWTEDPEEWVRDQYRVAYVGEITRLTGIKFDREEFNALYPVPTPPGFDPNAWWKDCKRGWITANRELIIKTLEGQRAEHAGS